MTTPEGSGPPADPVDGRSAWGRPPAGGWGDPAADRREPAGAGWADPGWADRGWADPGADPGADPWARRAGGPAWGAPPAAEAPTRPVAPGWAQQPPPGAGWNPGPPVPRWAPPPSPDGWGPPRGGPPPPWGPPDRAPRRSRTPLVVAGAVAALLALGAVLAFVAPGFLRSTVFDQAALQDGVRRVLLEDYRYARVEGVACGAPGEQIPVRVDATFTCSATVDGAPVTVPVRVTTADGVYEVDRPV